MVIIKMNPESRAVPNTTPEDAEVHISNNNKESTTSATTKFVSDVAAVLSSAGEKPAAEGKVSDFLAGNKLATTTTGNNGDKDLEALANGLKTGGGEDENDDEAPTEDVALTFPQKLMEILTNEEHSEIISWLPHGRGFMIYKKKQFETDVMPLHFHKHSKYTSFTRKLNRWGFVRVTRGPEMGAYYHKFFKKGEGRLCMQMSCQRPSGTGIGGTFAGVSTTADSNNRGASSAASNPAAAAALGGSLSSQMANMQSLGGAAAGGGIGGLFGAGSAADHNTLLQLQQQQQHMQLLMRHREQMLQREAMIAARGQFNPTAATSSMFGMATSTNTSDAAAKHQAALLSAAMGGAGQQDRQQQAADMAAMYGSMMGMNNPNLGGFGGYPPNMM